MLIIILNQRMISKNVIFILLSSSNWTKIKDKNPTTMLDHVQSDFFFYKIWQLNIAKFVSDCNMSRLVVSKKYVNKIMTVNYIHFLLSNTWRLTTNSLFELSCLNKYTGCLLETVHKFSNAILGAFRHLPPSLKLQYPDQYGCPDEAPNFAKSIFLCNSIRWPLFFYLHHNLQS